MRLRRSVSITAPPSPSAASVSPDGQSVVVGGRRMISQRLHRQAAPSRRRTRNPSSVARSTPTAGCHLFSDERSVIVWNTPVHGSSASSRAPQATSAPGALVRAAQWSAHDLAAAERCLPEIWSATGGWPEHVYPRQNSAVRLLRLGHRPKYPAGGGPRWFKFSSPRYVRVAVFSARSLRQLTSVEVSPDAGDRPLA